jgi:hypothetical protein
LKAIFCLPAHPSYFAPAQNYTQEEVDSAIHQYDKFTGGIISRGRPDLKVPVEFQLLREPGKVVQVIFNSAGLGDGKAIPGIVKDLSLEQYRTASFEELQIHVNNIKEYLRMGRARRF